MIAVIHGWPSRRTQRLRRAVGPGIGRHNDCERRAHLCGGGAKEWGSSTRSPAASLLRQARPLRARSSRGKFRCAAFATTIPSCLQPATTARYSRTPWLLGPRGIAVYNPASACRKGRSESRRSVRGGADARIQCVPQTVPVLIRSNNAGLSCTNASHNRDYKTFRQFERAILKFLKHTIPKNWNRLCDRITDNFPPHPR